MAQLSKEIKKIELEIIRWRQWFHQHPGIGFDVEEASHKIEKTLQEIGYEQIKRYAKTGVVAYIEKDKNYKTIAIRADMDALPLQEENYNLDYKSNYPGKMHACGHDAHMAMALGAAKYLYLNRHRLKVNVLFIFQPGEEACGGAEKMLSEGLYEDFPYDYFIGCHIGQIVPELATGQIGISYQPIMAATREFKLVVKGSGGHGAIPQSTVDPIVISANIISSIQTIISRNLSPVDSGIISFGEIQGGTAHNIIPNTVSLTGTVRYLTEESGVLIIERIKQLVDGITKAYGGHYHLEFKNGYPAVVNNKDFALFVKEKLMDIFIKDDIIDLNKATMGGEDVSYFLQKAPGCFFFLGGGNKEKGIIYPHHHSNFNIDEEVLWKGTLAFCQIALNLE